MTPNHLTAKHLKLMRDASEVIWATYDDTHGYRTEKLNAMAQVDLETPANVWFFWGQFDHANQAALLMIMHARDPVLNQDINDYLIKSNLSTTGEEVKEL